MTTRNYLSKLDSTIHVTFIKVRARKDAQTPFFHTEYQTTPIFYQDELNDKLLDTIILNDKQMPIDWLCGAQWGDLVTAGRLKCLLVVSEEDLATLYPSKEQRDSMERFIENKLY